VKNKKEREQYVDNPENWIVKEQTHFTRTLTLDYKGDQWIKVEHKEWSGYYDMTISKYVHCVKWMERGKYVLNDLHECLVPISRTEIVGQMAVLDKQYPDQASAPAIPDTIEYERPREG